MATDDEIVKKLVELKLADTPANRQLVVKVLNAAAQGAPTTPTTTVPNSTGLQSLNDFEQQIINLVGNAGTQKSGANYLLGYAYPQRIVKGKKADFLSTIPPADYISFGGGGGTTQKYVGPFLVDKNGYIARNQYDLSALGDANTILLEVLNKDPIKYKSYQSLLQTRGYYGDAKPSQNKVDNVDRSAMAEFLNNKANANGVTYDIAFEMLAADPQVLGLGAKAPSVRVTSDADLKVIFRKASTDLLGYEIDDTTAQKFAASYRQMEIAQGQKQAAGGVFESAASPSTVAAQQIRNQFGPEVAAVQAGDYAEIMDQSIKRLGS